MTGWELLLQGDSQELELSSEEIHIPIPVISFGPIAIDLKILCSEHKRLWKSLLLGCYVYVVLGHCEEPQAHTEVLGYLCCLDTRTCPVITHNFGMCIGSLISLCSALSHAVCLFS